MVYNTVVETLSIQWTQHEGTGTGKVIYPGVKNIDECPLSEVGNVPELQQ